MLYTWLINHSLLAKSVKYKYMNVPNWHCSYVGKSGIQVYVNNKPLVQTNNLFFIYIVFIK